MFWSVVCLFWSSFAPRLCSHPIMSQDASISQEKIVQTRISCGHVREEGVMLIQVERFITTETGSEVRGPGNCIPSQFTYEDLHSSENPLHKSSSILNNLRR